MTQIRQFITPLLILALLIASTIVIIAYARGYRLSPEERQIRGTGILVAKSKPDGAQIYLNGELKSATNTTLNLSPGKYKVLIKKEGFQNWEKEVTIYEEVVANTDTNLFPTNPGLSPLTNTGIESSSLSPQGNAIAFIRRDPEATSEAQTSQQEVLKRTGIFAIDLADRPLSLSRNPRLLASFSDLPSGLNLLPVNLIWSPDSKEILAIFGEKDSQSNQAFIISTTNSNTIPDRAFNIAEVLALWKEQAEIDKINQIKSLPEDLIPIATSSAEILSFSPDESKILYKATKNTTIPEIIIPPLIGTNPTPESRTIQPDHIYVYDIKEDRNYLIGSSGNFTWFPTSSHLLYTEENKIKIMEYDSTNKTTLYSGPFDQKLLVSWPDGSRLVIITNLNPDASQKLNLYALKLR